MSTNTLISTTFVYPLDNGQRYTIPPTVLSQNVPTGWVRLVLTSGLCLDMDATMLILTSNGFQSVQNIVGQYVQTTASAHNVVIDGEQYAITGSISNYLCTAVIQLTAGEAKIAGTYATYAPSGSTILCAVVSLPQQVEGPQSDVPYMIYPDDEELVPAWPYQDPLDPCAEVVKGPVFVFSSGLAIWTIYTNPVVSLGQIGDIAIDLTTSQFYVKDSVEWTSLGNYGPIVNGRSITFNYNGQGVTVLLLLTVPDNLPAPGDGTWAINVLNGLIYQYSVSTSSWTVLNQGT